MDSLAFQRPKLRPAKNKILQEKTLRQYLNVRNIFRRKFALSDHMGDLDPSNGCCRKMEGFEAHHRADDTFDEPI
jgi:hypothetical protein